MKGEVKLSISNGYKLFSIATTLIIGIICTNNVISNYYKFIHISGQNHITFLQSIAQNSFIICGFFAHIILLIIFYRRFILPVNDSPEAIAEETKDIVESSGISKTETDALRAEINALKEAKTQLVLQNEALSKKLSLSTRIDNNTDFFDNLSHEIRTPVQGISAISKGLVNNWNNFDNITNYELATKIANNSQRLFSLVDNILEFSKMKQGNIELKFHRINIAELLEGMVEEYKTLHLNKRDITINTHFKIDKNIALLVDENKIIQVMRNLLTNAVKSTTRGEIDIELDKNDTHVIISVKDEGIGIIEEDINKLFESSGYTRNAKDSSGTGIGLIVSKEIIKAHGGKIKAENNKDKGSKFSFTLPMTSSNLNASSIKVKTDIAAGTSRANVIIIDDEETCLLSLQMMLHNTNYILHIFSSPIKALEFLTGSPSIANIILLDLMMPELDGLEVLKQIKSHDILKNIPVVIQSGVADIKQIDQTLSLGAVDVLRKPYTRETLIIAIENILKSKS